MQWMTKLGSELDYKIVPKESLSIIGSSSKNTAGELYTIDIQFRIAQKMSKRNKRILDIFLSLGFLISLPILIWVIKEPINFVKNIFKIILGKLSWVGYGTHEKRSSSLPKIKAAVLSPLDALNLDGVNEHTIQRLNFLYAKDYELSDDLNIIWKGIRNLGN